MKFSEAMLKGYQRLDGKQCRGQMFRKDTEQNIIAACAWGAARLGGYRAARPLDLLAAWGFSEIALNDEEKLPWEHIYGMAVAVGL